MAFPAPAGGSVPPPGKSYNLLLLLIGLFFVLAMTLLALNPTGFDRWFGYGLFITVPLLLLVVVLFRAWANLPPAGTAANAYTPSNLGGIVAALASWCVSPALLSPVLLGLVVLLCVVALVAVLAIGGVFSQSPPANNTAVLTNILFFSLFLVVAVVMYMRGHNQDASALASMPPAVQELFKQRRHYTILFFLFAIATTLLYFYNPGGIMTRYAGPTFFFMLFIGFVLVGMITMYQFYWANPASASAASPGSGTTSSPGWSTFLGGLATLLAFAGGGALLFAVLYMMGIFQAVSSASSASWGSTFFRIFLFGVMVGILYKLVNAGGVLDKSPTYRLVLYTLLYIPCLLVNVLTQLGALLGLVRSAHTQASASASMFAPATSGEKKFLLGTLAAIVVYLLVTWYGAPWIRKRVTTQGGEEWIGTATPTNVLTEVASYQTLSGSSTYDYQYAISFWFYLDAFGYAASTADVPIVAYGKAPVVRYSSVDNALRVVAQHNDGDASERILCRIPHVQLQKWNHVVLNSHGGTLDVFYNDELVQSSVNVVQRIASGDMLTVGAPAGASGDVNHLVYFSKPIEVTTVHALYELGALATHH